LAGKLKLLVLFALIALVPLRGLAAIAFDFCSPAHQETLGDVAHEQGGEHHHHGSPNGDHCGTASFAAPATPAPLSGPVGSERIPGGDCFATGFVADHLDPPPLAL
jgi:hypothetical protein